MAEETKVGEQDGVEVFVTEFAKAAEGKPAESKPAETKPSEAAPVLEKKVEEPKPGTEQPIVAKEEPKPGATDYEDLYKKEVQRSKSWEGRINAAEKRAKELEGKVKELEKPSQPSLTPPVKENLVDVTDPLIKGFIDEMGEDFIKPLNAYMKKLIKEHIDPVLNQLKPVVDKVPVIEKELSDEKANKETVHYQTILDAHKDTPELVKEGKLKTYVESLPYTEAIRCQKIMESGSAKEVIELIDAYKKSLEGGDNGKEKPPSKVKSEQVIEATAVKGGSFNVPKGKPDANDFNGAFEEAVSQKQ